MNILTKIWIANFTCITIVSSAQKDSTNGIHIGCDFIVAPMLHLNDNGTFNTGTGLLFHVNMGNSIVFKLGAMYHIQPYSVIDDKYYSPDVKTTFSYVQKCFKVDIILGKAKRNPSFISFGILSGMGVYKEGIEHKYPIDYLNNQNLSFELGFGRKYQLSKNIFLNIEPCFSWFLHKVQSEYFEFGPSPYPAIAKLIGTDSQFSILAITSISYDFVNLKPSRK